MSRRGWRRQRWTAEAGGTFNALEKTFTVNVSDGRLDLGFKAVNKAAVVSAIAVAQQAAAAQQQKLSHLLHLLRHRYAVFGGCEVILNARGIPGRFAPAPMRRLNQQQREQLLAEPLVRELLS